MKNYFEYLKSLDPHVKKKSLYIFFTYFFALFSYPLVRSATGAYFYESYTANEYSLATFMAIMFLLVLIFICNKLQKRFGIHRLYLYLSLFSTATLLISAYLHSSGFKPFAFVLFAVKESYIVLLIHLCLAYANNSYSLEQVKKLFGPLGALGSIGGIIGGQLTSILAKNYGTDLVFYISLIFVAATGLVFYRGGRGTLIVEEKKEKRSPLRSVKDIKSFVVLIAAIVAITQWVIFIADLKFNFVFAKMITEKNARTSYLGSLYSYINMLSLAIQLILIPYLISRVSNKKVFFIIPIVYLGLSALVFGVGGSSMLIAAGTFIFMKASDYSVFAYSKEVLYHGLSEDQKFGTKYITDMFVYRLAKALIAFVMSFYLVKNFNVLNLLQVILILVWIACVYLLFKKQRN